MKAVATAGGELRPRTAKPWRALRVTCSTPARAWTSQTWSRRPAPRLPRHFRPPISVAILCSSSRSWRSSTEPWMNENSAVALAYASDLGVKDDYVRDIAETAKHHIDWVRADMSRNNAESIQGMVSGQGLCRAIPALRHDPNPALTTRFRALAPLPYESFGRAFYDHYTEAGYIFPGAAAGLKSCSEFHTIALTWSADTVHRSRANYWCRLSRPRCIAVKECRATSAGDLQSAHGDRAESARRIGEGRLRWQKFWRAWERGRLTTLDTFGPDWDFWGLVETPLDQIRSSYNVAPLDAAHAADGVPGPVRPWTE